MGFSGACLTPLVLTPMVAERAFPTRGPFSYQGVSTRGLGTRQLLMGPTMGHVMGGVMCDGSCNGWGHVC